MINDDLLIYRYRPTNFYYKKDNKIISKSVLEEFDNQEIFLGSTSENNDPMDGFHNVFWEGDSILWKNFIYHYALCFFDSLLEVQSLGNTSEFTSHLIRVKLTPIDLESEEYKNNYTHLQKAVDE